MERVVVMGTVVVMRGQGVWSRGQVLLFAVAYFLTSLLILVIPYGAVSRQTVKISQIQPLSFEWISDKNTLHYFHSLTMLLACRNIIGIYDNIGVYEYLTVSHEVLLLKL